MAFVVRRPCTMRRTTAMPTKLIRQHRTQSAFERIHCSAVKNFKGHFLARDVHDRSRFFSLRGPYVQRLCCFCVVHLISYTHTTLSLPSLLQAQLW